MPVCKCGRDEAGVNGVCGFCVAEGAAAFWALTDGILTLDEFLEINGRAGAFPVAGDMVTCGLRDDLPRRARRHVKVSLGADTDNQGAAGIAEVPVFACLRCGRDLR